MVNQSNIELTMISIPVFEAKTRLSELLQQAQQGEEIVITRHGVPMARLVPPVEGSRRAAASSQMRRVEAAFDALTDLRQGVSLDVPLADAVRAGRD
jgi:prevent-host-death family protein